ncbi:MAG: hypothetical protein AB1489_38365 [Acidobacteriota bacterium]
MGYLTVEDLLAGSSLTHDVEIPIAILSPLGGASPSPAKIRLRPLTVRDVQRVMKAAKDNDTLLSILMLKEALVEPALSFEQVNSMHAGLMRFLLNELNRISGLAVEENGIAAAVQAPLAKACFILAKEFGWTPQEVAELTMGQILLYLEMLKQDSREG